MGILGCLLKIGCKNSAKLHTNQRNGVHLVAQGDRVAVDLDLARRDQALGLAAGADALVGQYLLNTLFCH